MPTIAFLSWNWAAIPATHGALNALLTKQTRAAAATLFAAYLKCHSNAREYRNAARQLSLQILWLRGEEFRGTVN
jgi:hypothetical protein